MPSLSNAGRDMSGEGDHAESVDRFRPVLVTSQAKMGTSKYHAQLPRRRWRAKEYTASSGIKAMPKYFVNAHKVIRRAEIAK